MIKFTKQELKHIKNMLEETKDMEGFEKSKPNIEIILNQFSSVNEVEALNALLTKDVLEEFYAWYWLNGFRYNLTLDEMCEEMTNEDFFNENDVSIFRKINTEENKELN